jgi:hypothetical protein
MSRPPKLFLGRLFFFILTYARLLTRAARNIDRALAERRPVPSMRQWRTSVEVKNVQS